MVGAMVMAALAASPQSTWEPMQRWGVPQQSFACGLTTSRGEQTLFVVDFAGDQSSHYFGINPQGHAWPGRMVVRNVRARKTYVSETRFRFRFDGQYSDPRRGTFELIFSGGEGGPSEADISLSQGGVSAAGHCSQIPLVPPVNEE